MEENDAYDGIQDEIYNQEYPENSGMSTIEKILIGSLLGIGIGAVAAAGFVAYNHANAYNNSANGAAAYEDSHEIYDS